MTLPLAIDPVRVPAMLPGLAQGSERGATAAEHAMLLSGVAALVVAAVLTFGGSVEALFSDTCDTVQTARQSASCAP